MTNPIRFDPSTHTIGLSRSLDATVIQMKPGPPVQVDGVTIGVASMSQNAPHCGERHPDGDEVLYLISGRANLVFVDDDFADIELQPGTGTIVPKGVWHRVDVIEPIQILYVTPGPNHGIRFVEGEA